MNTVWVVNHRGHDLSKATAYGELKVLTEGPMNVFAVDRHIKDFKSKLKNSTVNDFVLCCGSIPLNAIVTSLMLTLHGKVNLLLYNLKGELYLARTYTAEDLKDVS